MGLSEQSLRMLNELVEFGRKHNLKVVSVANVEIEFFEPHKPIISPTALESETEERGPSEDELLFYSTDTYDSLREERDNAKD